MSEMEEKVLNTFKKVMPILTQIEKEKLLSFGEGIAFFKESEKEKKEG